MWFGFAVPWKNGLTINTLSVLHTFLEDIFQICFLEEKSLTPKTLFNFEPNQIKSENLVDRLQKHNSDLLQNVDTSTLKIKWLE